MGNVYLNRNTSISADEPLTARLLYRGLTLVADDGIYWDEADHYLESPPPARAWPGIYAPITGAINRYGEAALNIEARRMLDGAQKKLIGTLVTNYGDRFRFANIERFPAGIPTPSGLRETMAAQIWDSLSKGERLAVLRTHMDNLSAQVGVPMQFRGVIPATPGIRHSTAASMNPINGRLRVNEAVLMGPLGKFVNTIDHEVSHRLQFIWGLGRIRQINHLEIRNLFSGQQISGWSSATQAERVAVLKKASKQAMRKIGYRRFWRHTVARSKDFQEWVAGLSGMSNFNKVFGRFYAEIHDPLFLLGPRDFNLTRLSTTGHMAWAMYSSQHNLPRGGYWPAHFVELQGERIANGVDEAAMGTMSRRLMSQVARSHAFASVRSASVAALPAMFAGLDAWNTANLYHYDAPSSVIAMSGGAAAAETMSTAASIKMLLALRNWGIERLSIAVSSHRPIPIRALPLSRLSISEVVALGRMAGGFGVAAGILGSGVDMGLTFYDDESSGTERFLSITQGGIAASSLAILWVPQLLIAFLPVSVFFQAVRNEAETQRRTTNLFKSFVLRNGADFMSRLKHIDTPVAIRFIERVMGSNPRLFNDLPNGSHVMLQSILDRSWSKHYTYQLLLEALSGLSDYDYMRFLMLNGEAEGPYTVHNWLKMIDPDKAEKFLDIYVSRYSAIERWPEQFRKGVNSRYGMLFNTF